MSNHEDIFKASKEHITKAFSCNEISADDYAFAETNHGDYHFLVKLTYSFHVAHDKNRVAGGEGVQGRHYTPEAYKEINSKNYRYAQDAGDEKREFIEKSVPQLKLRVVANEKLLVWDSPTISYSYDCSACHGRGKVTCIHCGGNGRSSCSSCSGSGKVTRLKTVTGSSGISHSEDDIQMCSACSGTGRSSCFSCYGSGEERCSSCSGHGFFTEYSNIYCSAHPSITYSTERGIHAIKIVEYFSTKTVEYLCTVMAPEYSDGEWLQNGDYQFTMKAPITVVENTVTVHGEKFIEVAVNNDNSVFSPPIFDHLLEKPYSILQAYSAAPRQSKTAMLDTYNALKEFYTLNELLCYLKIVNDSGATRKEDKIKYLEKQIRTETKEYISNAYSHSISENMVTLMDRLAPNANVWLWRSLALFFMLVDILVASHIGFYSLFGGIGVYEEAINLIWPVVAIELVLVLIFAIPAITINRMTLEKKHRGIDERHKPKISYREPLIKVIRAVAIAWAVSLAIIYFMHQ